MPKSKWNQQIEHLFHGACMYVVGIDAYECIYVCLRVCMCICICNQCISDHGAQIIIFSEVELTICIKY